MEVFVVPLLTIYAALGVWTVEAEILLFPELLLTFMHSLLKQTAGGLHE